MFRGKCNFSNFIVINFVYSYDFHYQYKITLTSAIAVTPEYSYKRIEGSYCFLLSRVSWDLCHNQKLDSPLLLVSS